MGARTGRHAMRSAGYPGLLAQVLAEAVCEPAPPLSTLYSSQFLTREFTALIPQMWPSDGGSCLSLGLFESICSGFQRGIFTGNR